MEGRKTRYKFPETNINLLGQLKTERESVQLVALGEFSEKYWSPLYFFVVQNGYSKEDAQDLVQGFFEKLIRDESLSRFDREKGRLRTFLLTLLKRHLIDCYRKHAARAGSREHQCVEEVEPPDEGAERKSAERAYDLRWAIEISDQTLKKMEASYKGRGKGESFDLIAPLILKRPENGDLKQLSANLKISEGAANGQLHRTRQRFKKEFEKTVAETTNSEAEAAEEVRYLYSLLGILF